MTKEYFTLNCNVLVRPLRKGRHFLGKEVKGKGSDRCIPTKGGLLKGPEWSYAKSHVIGDESQEVGLR